MSPRSHQYNWGTWHGDTGGETTHTHLQTRLLRGGSNLVQMPRRRPCPGVPQQEEPLGPIGARLRGAAAPTPALPGTAAPCRGTLSPRENQRENDARQPEKHHVSRSGRFLIPKELPVSIFKAVLKNTLKYSP